MGEKYGEGDGEGGKEREEGLLLPLTSSGGDKTGREKFNNPLVVARFLGDDSLILKLKFFVEVSGEVDLTLCDSEGDEGAVE